MPSSEYRWQAGWKQRISGTVADVDNHAVVLCENVLRKYTGSIWAEGPRWDPFGLRWLKMAENVVECDRGHHPGEGRVGASSSCCNFSARIYVRRKGKRPDSKINRLTCGSMVSGGAGSSWTRAVVGTPRPPRQLLPRSGRAHPWLSKGPSGLLALFGVQFLILRQPT